MAILVIFMTIWMMTVMSNILILDFETTGLDSKTDFPVEIGFILYSNKKLLSISSFLIDQEIEKLPDTIEELIDLKTESWKQNAIANEKYVLRYINAMRFNFGYFIAHFGLQFDELFFKEMVNRNNQENEFDDLLKIPWLDSSIDCLYPKHITTRKLQYIASEYGYVNPYQHRALFDCIALAKILDHQDIDLMIERSKEALYDIEIEVAKPWTDGSVSKDYAKNNGFKFNPESKTWSKKMLEKEYSQTVFEYPVKITNKVVRNEGKFAEH